MSDLVPIRRALISVSDKTDLVPFARSLVEIGVEIISTGGTARALLDAGVEVIPVETVTGFPEMMDGRVKTLHPAIHGALLARRDHPDHREAMTTHGIHAIDLVCVNLYPFERTIKAPDTTPEEAIEQIDIGGPSMLRSAAKNHRFVTVVTAADQYDRVVHELRRHDGATNLELRRDLAAAAFMRTAEYDTMISAWMCSRRDDPFPPLLRLSYAHQSDLRYGENPHQRGAVYANPSSAEPSVVRATVRHGKPLSYNNLNDASVALRLTQDLHELFPDQMAAVILKHTNPCGAAVADDPGQAFLDAYEGNPVAAYGGILSTNFAIDGAAAAPIADGQRFLEVIVAPRFDQDAIATLGERWKNVRLLEVGSLGHTRHRKIDYRSLAGGMLVQERDMKVAMTREWTHVAGPPLDPAALPTAQLAWTVSKHLTSNAIAIAGDGRLLGAGSGQVDRVSACRHAAAMTAPKRDDLTHVVAASDAFFPFPDGPEVLIDTARVTCIVQPGGSKRDDETIALCNERGVTCMLTGVRHFRH